MKGIERFMTLGHEHNIGCGDGEASTAPRAISTANDEVKNSVLSGVGFLVRGSVAFSRNIFLHWFEAVFLLFSSSVITQMSWTVHIARPTRLVWARNTGRTARPGWDGYTRIDV